MNYNCDLCCEDVPVEDVVDFEIRIGEELPGRYKVCRECREKLYDVVRTDGLIDTLRAYLV